MVRGCACLSLVSLGAALLTNHSLLSLKLSYPHRERILNILQGSAGLLVFLLVVLLLLRNLLELVIEALLEFGLDCG